MGMTSARRSPLRMAATTEPQPAEKEESTKGKRVIVVGGGWAGFGSALALAERGCEVTLLDALPNPGGLASGFRTEKGFAVEAGIKGFWYQYNNIFKLLHELGLEEWPLTNWTESRILGPDGRLITSSPIFSSKPRLPTVLGQFVYTADLFPTVSLADRATMFPLFNALLDFRSSPQAYEDYDQMTARELFKRAGVSQTLYDEFLKPLLLVGLFAPPEDLSAAAMLGAFEFYALAHQYDFDVCWCRGSVSELIFGPLIKAIESAGGKVKGGFAVQDVKIDESGKVTGVVAKETKGAGTECVFEADAVVMAVGVNAMKKIVKSSSALAKLSSFRGVQNLRSVDCLSARISYDKLGSFQTPSNVLAGFEPDIGATVFHLNDFQDEFFDSTGSVIASDWYHAGALLPLSDKEVVDRISGHVQTICPELKGSEILDYAVVRIPQAVTLFSPGSHRYRLKQQSEIKNLFVAGDWVRDLDHGSDGLSQERALVSGYQAANLALQHFRSELATGLGDDVSILPVESDETHVSFGKNLYNNLRQGYEQVRRALPVVPFQ